MKYLVLIFCLASTFSFAQTATVTGTIIDASTNEPLSFASVYFNSTTLGTRTNAQGSFEIRGVSFPGAYELIVSFVGYESVSLKMNISQALVPLRAIRLKPSKTMLGLVEVKSKRDDVWEKRLERFTTTFLGNDKEAAQCKIVNPWVIDFRENKEADVLLATAVEPIIIENLALGYRIKFTLQFFSADAENYKISGKTFFEEMSAQNTAQWTSWHRERENAYHNSKQFLLKSIVQKHINSNGFKLYTQIEGRSKRTELFMRNLGVNVIETDTSKLISNGPGDGLYVITIPGRMEVHNTRKIDKKAWYRDVNYSVSWIELKGGTAIVNKHGYEVQTSNIVTEGTMNDLRMSRSLPTDYEADTRDASGSSSMDYAYLEEKLYVQTDKPYYYPGETIWYKGYIRYRTPSLRDSLSKTVYAEFIGSDKKVKASQILEVTDATFHHQFELPDTITPGNYFLRFYTAMNRNFGDDKLYLKVIPVLEKTQVIDPLTKVTTSDNGLLAINFENRDSIEIDLLPGNDSIRVGNSQLSVSVTDLKEVMPVEFNSTITKELELGELMNFTLKYPLERGFSFRGNFEGRLKRNFPWMTIVRLEPRSSIIVPMDNEGNFEVSALNFYDSAYFSVFATGDNNGGEVTLIPRDIASIYLPQVEIPVKQTETIQRPTYSTKGVNILKEVKVEATKIDPNRPIKNRFGMPDRVVSSKELFASGETNIFMAIRGKFPGLQVREIMDRDNVLRPFVFLRLNARGRYPSEVVVTIDDNLQSGTPFDVLNSISIGMISSIELIRNSPLLGDKGINGVLALYTNPSGTNAEPESSRKIIVHGYQHPAIFNGDFSTIYWNPDVKLDDSGKARIRFKATNLQTTYKIVIEGITVNGEPIRAEKTISIN